MNLIRDTYAAFSRLIGPFRLTEVILRAFSGCCLSVDDKRSRLVKAAASGCDVVVPDDFVG